MNLFDQIAANFDCSIFTNIVALDNALDTCGRLIDDPKEIWFKNNKFRAAVTNERFARRVIVVEDTETSKVYRGGCEWRGEDIFDIIECTWYEIEDDLAKLRATFRDNAHTGEPKLQPYQVSAA